MTTPVQIPIDGVLDLHSFLPEEVASLLKDYIMACHEKGILELRIIHGKGKGVLRNTVHHILDKQPMVAHYHDDYGPSGWGATVVYLRRG